MLGTLVIWESNNTLALLLPCIISNMLLFSATKPYPNFIKSLSIFSGELIVFEINSNYDSDQKFFFIYLWTWNRLVFIRSWKGNKVVIFRICEVIYIIIKIFKKFWIGNFKFLLKNFMVISLLSVIFWRLIFKLRQLTSKHDLFVSWEIRVKFLWAYHRVIRNLRIYILF